MSTKPKIEIRDRILELRRVPASELIPNLKKLAPASGQTKEAMRAVLSPNPASVPSRRSWSSRQPS